ncbi:DUF4396 domain-containing protein [bacterium]|nr:DUF4396 domain-containing protein [bacterium]
MTDWSLPGIGPLAWIDVVVLAWFFACLLSLVYVAWDIRSTPEATVMKWAWLLIILYMGPVGAGLYILTDKEPRPGAHEEFIRPLWKQGIGSTVHCIAGDATGIIVAATITAVLGFPMWLDIMVEYLCGFAVGLFIFQALFMKSMFENSYSKGLHDHLPRDLVGEARQALRVFFDECRLLQNLAQMGHQFVKCDGALAQTLRRDPRGFVVPQGAPLAHEVVGSAIECGERAIPLRHHP